MADRRTADRRAPENAPTRALLTYFDEKHREATGHPAVIQGGKDAKLLAGLWRSHGEALTLALMDDFFASDDDWIVSNGYTVGMFLSQAGKLIARRVRPPQARKGTAAAYSMESAREALRAMNGDGDADTREPGGAGEGADALGPGDEGKDGSADVPRLRGKHRALPDRRRG